MYDQDEFEITSNQPYMVLETKKFYQHIQDSKGISHFYTFTNESENDLSVPLIADSCTNIIFSYKDGKVKAFTIGSIFDKTTITLEKNTTYFGIRFQPGENPCYQNSDAIKEYSGKQADLENFPQMESLVDKMKNQSTFYNRVNTFLDEYTNMNFDISVKHKLYRQFIRLIVSKKGILKISELVELTGYSARYINQIFEDVSGMSAKQFCNNVKLQHIIADMNKDNVETISQLSSDYKYYDMAHFIHEFKNFTGKTPGAYLNMIKESKYKQMIINA